jgi:IS30 family transposase
MPYWFETQKKKLPKNKDRRRKLTDKDRKKIKQLYDDGFGIREIAKKFEKKVCRRSIQFILFPERKRKQNWKDFYNREKHTIAMRKCRKHRKEIFGLR